MAIYWLCRLCTLKLVVMAAVGCSVLTAAAAADDAKTPGKAANAAEAVEALRIAYAQWRASASCRGNYRFLKGFLREPEQFNDVAILEANAKIGRATSASGFFAVDGRKWRFSRIFDQEVEAIKLVDPIVETMTVGKNLSMDQIYDNHLVLIYTPLQDKIGGTVQVGSVEISESLPSGSAEQNKSAIFLPNPIEAIQCPAGGMPGEPHPLPDAANYRISEVSEDIIRLAVDVEVPNSAQNSRLSINYSIDWSYGNSSPVITRIESTYTSKDGSNKSQSRSTTMTVSIDDFTDLDSFPVGRHVTVIQKGDFQYAGGKPAGLALVTHWMSKDLGSSRPTSEDFKIKVPKDVAVAGIKNMVRTSEQATISLADLGASDLLEPGGDIPLQPAKLVPPSTPRGRWLLFINIAALTLLIVLIVRNRVMRASKKP